VIAPPAWYDRYGHRAEEYRLPRAAAAREAYAQAIGADGAALVAALAAPGVPPALASLAAVTTLRDCARAWRGRSPRRCAFGLLQARYRGLSKTRLQHAATAAALNLARVAA